MKREFGELNFPVELLVGGHTHIMVLKIKNKKVIVVKREPEKKYLLAASITRGWFKVGSLSKKYPL